MLIAVIIVSILLFLSLVFIITLGIDDGWHFEEWFATILFIFAFPVWIIAKIVVIAKGKLEEKRIRARRKELEETKLKN